MMMKMKVMMKVAASCRKKGDSDIRDEPSYMTKFDKDLQYSSTMHNLRHVNTFSY